MGRKGEEKTICGLLGDGEYHEQLERKTNLREIIKEKN